MRLPGSPAGVWWMGAPTKPLICSCVWGGGWSPLQAHDWSAVFKNAAECRAQCFLWCALEFDSKPVFLRA